MAPASIESARVSVVGPFSNSQQASMAIYHKVQTWPARVVLAGLGSLCLLWTMLASPGLPPLASGRGLIHDAGANASPLQSTSPATARFPKKLWQTWRRPYDQLKPQLREYSSTWGELNPEYRRELLTHEAMETYVAEAFADRPEVLEAYEALHHQIYKIDFLRYLILLKEGGVYSDIDTKVLKPISTWIPAMYREEDIGLVIGMEIDDEFEDKGLVVGFSQYTMMAKPGHPVLQAVVDRIMQIGLDAKRDNLTLPRTDPDVITITGPLGWTRTITETLSRMTETELTKLDWRYIDETPDKSKLVADVLILPINAFGSGQAHSRSLPAHEANETSLVSHLFRGSWRENPWSNVDDFAQS